jgi:hypothetical protein
LLIVTTRVMDVWMDADRTAEWVASGAIVVTATVMATSIASLDVDAIAIVIVIRIAIRFGVVAGTELS